MDTRYTPYIPNVLVGFLDLYAAQYFLDKAGTIATMESRVLK